MTLKGWHYTVYLADIARSDPDHNNTIITIKRVAIFFVSGGSCLQYVKKKMQHL